MIHDADTGTASYCTGTIVEGADDRTIILTAAHCIIGEDANGNPVYPEYALFIPKQDDGGSDTTDIDCSNDVYGCIPISFAVVSTSYETANTNDSTIRLNYDYGFFVAEGVTTDNGTELTPVPINFEGMTPYVADAGVFGYPADADPEFMYSQGELQTSPLNEGYYMDCSTLGQGASGGPWTDHDIDWGFETQCVTSWIWADGSSGVGCAPLHTGGAECVYNAALSADLASESFAAECGSFA